MTWPPSFPLLLISLRIDSRRIAARRFAKRILISACKTFDASLLSRSARAAWPSGTPSGHAPRVLLELRQLSRGGSPRRSGQLALEMA